MKAVICPVCSGTGKYQELVCHGCSGKGWVEVQDFSDYFRVVPQPPTIPPYQPYYPYPLPNTPWYYNPGPTCHITWTISSEVRKDAS